MEADTIKKESKTKKGGWLPFFVITGGLILLMIAIKLLMKLIAH